MSAPVDARAVMELAEAALKDANFMSTWDKVRKARAEVSELIAKGDRLTAAFRALGLDNSLVNRSRLARECEEAIVAFDAALARAKGASA